MSRENSSEFSLKITTIEVLANRGSRPSTEELPQISQIVVKYGGNKVLSDLLAQLMLSDETLEDVYESTLFLMDRLKNIKDSTPIIEAIDSHFDQFSEEQKKILMQHALRMQNMRPAQLLSGKMGCSVKTRKGLLKVLPLIDYCTNPHWANKILNEGLLTEKVSNEFGETTGLQAFSNAMLASFSIYYRFWGVKDNLSLKLTHFSKKLLLSFGSGQKYKTIEDYTQKISEGIRGIENEKLFSFLLKKDEFGNYLVRSERRNFKNLDASLQPSQSEPGLNALLSNNLPTEPSGWSRDRHFDQKAILVEACQKFPEEVREASRVLLFDLDQDGKETINPFFQLNFWDQGLNSDARFYWVKHLDVLLEHGVLNAEQARIVLEGILDLSNFEKGSQVRMLLNVKERHSIKVFQTLEKFYQGMKDRGYLEGFVDTINSQALLNEIDRHIQYSEGEGCQKLLNLVQEITANVEKEILLKSSDGPEVIKRKNLVKI